MMTLVRHSPCLIKEYDSLKTVFLSIESAQDNETASDPKTRKRKRTSGEASTKAISKPRKKGKLSSLLTLMPNEVICQVRSPLHCVSATHLSIDQYSLVIHRRYPIASGLSRSAPTSFPKTSCISSKAPKYSLDSSSTRPQPVYGEMLVPNCPTRSCFRTVRTILLNSSMLAWCLEYIVRYCC